MQLSEIISAVKPAILSEMVSVFSGVGTDTRVDLRQQLFVALAGPTYDAHNFLDEAIKSGASGLLVHDREKGLAVKDKATVIYVKDTLVALQQLGTFWRDKNNAKILSVTGSNGKTTTKEFAAAVIGANKKTYFNKGSFNNHWGVPLSLLNIEPQHEVAVIEMGMNHLGEISHLCSIAKPDVVLVTNVGRVHLEGLGTIENVAKAKEEIYQSKQKGLIRVFNLDNAYTKSMWEKYRSEPNITFSSLQEGADIFIKIAGENEAGLNLVGRIKGVSGEARVEVFGPHNVYNLMGAAALALSVNIAPQKIWDSLKFCKTPWGRNQKVNLKSGAKVIFDGYNANPESMGVMIDNSHLINVSGRRIAVIGEMRETGDAKDQLHSELGQKAASGKFDLIWFVGAPSEAFSSGLKKAGFTGDLLISEKFDPIIADRIKNALTSSDQIWIKGSRGIKLEQVVVALDPIGFSAKY